MKTNVKFNDIFFLCSLFIAFLSDWSVASCFLVICASIFILTDTIPQIRKYVRKCKKH